MTLLLLPLRWLGRHGTIAVALSLLVGMALPPLSTLAKPILPEAVFLLLLLAFLRVEPGRLVPWLRRPRLAVLATLWILAAWPLATALVLRAGGFVDAAPAVALAVTLAAVAPPTMSTPSFAQLAGLDGSLPLAVLLAAFALTPLLSPALSQLAVGAALPLSAPHLALRLALLLGGAFLVAQLLRRLLGRERMAEAGSILDGLTVVVLFVFAVAIMDGVAVRLVAEPMMVLGLTLLSSGLAAAMAASTYLVFRPAGREPALALSLAAGNRNMGLMAAALVGSVPDTAWVYFAVGQLPIYMTPLIAQKLVRRLRHAPAPERTGDRPSA